MKIGIEFKVQVTGYILEFQPKINKVLVKSTYLVSNNRNDHVQKQGHDVILDFLPGDKEFMDEDYIRIVKKSLAGMAMVNLEDIEVILPRQFQIKPGKIYKCKQCDQVSAPLGRHLYIYQGLLYHLLDHEEIWSKSGWSFEWIDELYSYFKEIDD